MKKDKFLELIVNGSEYIDVKAEFLGEKYVLPACRREDGVYRIPHKALEYMFKCIRDKHVDVRMCMDKEFLYISPTYCVAGCHLETQDGESEPHFGEIKVQMSSNEAEKNSPFNIAINRARDKVILKEVFGLYTRNYDAEGNPVLYENETEEPEAPALNSVEQKEFEELGAHTVPIRKSDGSTVNATLSAMPDNLLQYIAASADPTGIMAEHKQKAARYYELKEKAGKVGVPASKEA